MGVKTGFACDRMSGICTGVRALKGLVAACNETGGKRFALLFDPYGDNFEKPAVFVATRHEREVRGYRVRHVKKIFKGSPSLRCFSLVEQADSAPKSRFAICEKVAGALDLLAVVGKGQLDSVFLLLL